MPDADGFEVVIGLEIHVQLQTRTKLFCGCANDFGGAPNSRTCPVCLGHPGALPVLNKSAVEYATRAALALGCELNRRSRFARKNYFYPDLPKGYQISQFDEPLAGRGSFAFDSDGGDGGDRSGGDGNGGSGGGDGERREVRLQRIHLEEDAGKSIHAGMPRSAAATYVDLNRCGVPLIEIVTEPDIRGIGEAGAFLEALRNTLLYLGVTDANMDEGSLRCDANISLRRHGETKLNPKTELKNLNSFRFLRRALRFEVRRQAVMLAAGTVPAQSTRSFDERSGETAAMRAKEEAHDYRYFPEPDLVPIELDEAGVAAAAARIPELPLAKRDRFVAAHGLAADAAAHLVERRPRADYFEALVGAGVAPAEANKWLRNDIARWCNEAGVDIDEFPLAAPQIAELIAAVSEGVIAAGSAALVMEQMAETGSAAAAIIAAAGLEQISGGEQLAPVVDEVLAAHPEEVAAYRGGREQVLGFLMGQVMRATRGKAKPDTARELLRERLRAES